MNLFEKFVKDKRIVVFDSFINGEKVKINVYLDRSGRIINCDRIGRLFDLLSGRQLLSMSGLNEDIQRIIDFECERIAFI